MRNMGLATFSGGKLNRFARLDRSRRRSLAAGTKIAGRLTALARRAGWILKGDRTRDQAGIQEVRLVDHVGALGGGGHHRQEEESRQEP